MTVLEAKRIELGLVHLATDTPDYQITLRGGENLHIRTGRYYDSIRAEAQTQQANDFASECQLNRSFAMDVILYSEEACKVICKGWAARMQFLLNQFVDNGCTWHDVFLEGFEEDPAIEAAARDGDAALRRRIGAMRAPKPRPLE
jgi:hypothetical protein